MPLSKEEVDAAIERLKALDLKTADYWEVRKYTDVLVRGGFLTAIFPKELQDIYRGRVVDPAKVYHNVKEIGYPPLGNPANLTFNRLSTNKFQVFYGATTSQELRADQLVAMIEVGSIMEEGVEEEHIQIGQWIVKKDFRMATLGLHSTLVDENPQAKQMKKIHSEITKKLDEKGIMVETIAQFMSTQFSKKVAKDDRWEYKITAAYGDGIFETGIGAILFPSVKADGKEFNIALRKEIVDNALEIRVGAIARVRKVGKTEILVDWFLGSPTITEGKFRWVDPPRSTVTGEVEMKWILQNMTRNSGKFVNPKQPSVNDKVNQS